MVAGQTIALEIQPREGSDKTKDLKVPKWDVESSKVLHGFWKETKEILKLSFPVAMTNLFQFFICTTSLMMNGGFSKFEMDGVALANCMIDAFGLAIGIGLCTACDTMFSQSFGGKNKKRTGMWLQKSFLVINCCAFVVVSVLLNFEPILVLIGQDPNVARIAAEYMALFTPGIFCQFNYVILARYLQTQNKIFVPMVAGVLGNVFNVTTQYVLIHVYNFGYQASSLCQVGGFGIMFLVEAIYIVMSKFYVDTWDGFKREALTSWKEFFCLALAGVGHVTLECVCWEIGTFVAGILGTTELAVQSILFQTETILFTCSFGISIAVNIRVGQNLGGNRPYTAKRAMVVGWIVGLCYSVPCGCLIILLRSHIPTLFTTHSDVISSTSAILPLMALFLVIDTTHVISAGALRGSGRQRLGAIFIFFGFYIFAEPIGISLAFLTSLNVLGLWLGILCGLLITCSLEFLALFRQNWQEEAMLAQFRVARAKMPASSSDENTALLPKPPVRRHTHTLSEPYGCSIEVAKLTRNEDISDEVFSRLVLQRILTFVAVAVFLGAGLAVRFALPESVYLPLPSNGTAPDIGPSNGTALYFSPSNGTAVASAMLS